MQRLALPTAAVVITSLIAPAAHAATMAETYTPYFDPAPRDVVGKQGDYYAYPTYYDLEGAPEGSTWKLNGENTTRKLMQLQKVGDQLEVKLNHNDKTPVQPGPNTQSIDLKVTFPDGSWDWYFPAITLVPDEAFVFDPTYEAGKGDPGETVTLVPTNQHETPLPEDATWSLKGGAGYNAQIDQKTGTITATVPKDSYENANFEVEVTFKDDSKRKTWTSITNTGVGVVAKQTPAPAPEPTPEPAGSTPLQKVALVVGILAVIAGIGALVMPYLPL